MIDERCSTQRMLVLRRLTRAITDLLHGQLREYLSALAPLLRPRSILGDYAQGGTREGLRGSEKALQELQSTYKTVASFQALQSAQRIEAPPADHQFLAGNRSGRIYLRGQNGSA